jgi:hypothetical protein
MRQDCGFSGGCVMASDTEGSCSCGAPGTAFPSLDERGMCLSTNTVNNELEWACSPTLGIIFPTNCRAETGRASGFCSTYVTSFGWVSECYCDRCSTYDSGANTCHPLCPSMQCSYAASSNTHTCW